MGYRDLQVTLSNNQAVTTTAASTNVLDLGDVGHQIGQSFKIPRLRVMVTTTFAGTTTATSMSVALQDSLTAGGSFADTEIKALSIPVASLVAGAVLLDVPVPRSGMAAWPNLYGSPFPAVSLRRFIQFYYTRNGSGSWTAGKIMAWLDME